MSEPNALYNFGHVDHINLRPCLKCGGEAIFLEEHYAYGMNLLNYYIQCVECNEQVAMTREGYKDYDFIIRKNPTECEVRDWENIAFIWNELNTLQVEKDIKEQLELAAMKKRLSGE